MKKTLAVGFMVLVIVLAVTSAAAEAAEDFQTLLNRLNAGDTTIDFARLRYFFASLPDYNPYQMETAVKSKQNEMIQAYQDGRPADALGIGAAILELNPLHIMTHYLLSVIHEQSPEPDSAQKQQFHEHVFFGLVDSIIQSGDGTSPEQAMKVISITEEYDVLRVFGLQLYVQSVEEHGGRDYDVLTAVDPETEAMSELYFDISLFYESESGPDGDTLFPEPVSTSDPPSLVPSLTDATPVPAFPDLTESTPAPLPAFTPPPAVTPAAPRELVTPPPSGWVSAPTDDPDVIAYYQLPNQQGIVVAEHLVSRDREAGSQPLEAYFQSIQSQHLQTPDFPGYLPQGTSSTTLAGLPALRHDFSFQYGTTPIRAMAVITILDSTAYVFLFLSTPADFPALEPYFAQVLSLVSVSAGTGTSPLPDPGGELPGIATPIPARHQDPSGLFTLPLPAGSVFSQAIQNGVVYAGPNGGEIYVMTFPSEGEAQNMAGGLAQGKTLRAETTLPAGTRNALIKIYGFAQGDINYTMLAATYPSTPLLLVIVIPAQEYSSAQGWMTQLFTSVQFN